MVGVSEFHEERENEKIKGGRGARAVHMGFGLSFIGGFPFFSLFCVIKENGLRNFVRFESI